MYTRVALLLLILAMFLLAHSKKFWGTITEFIRSLNATIFPLNIWVPYTPVHSNCITSAPMAPSEICGRSLLGANTVLYNSR